MKAIETIYLDVHGVCCDFTGPACRIHGQDYEKIKENWKPGEGWNFYEKWGVTAEEFWEPINNNPEFWRSLPEHKWFPELYKMTHEFAKEVVFATSPSQCPSSQYGVAQWLNDRGIDTSNNLMMGAKKHKLANPHAVLIDDKELNCELFNERGCSILFPQHWNRNYEQQESNLEQVETQLKNITEMMNNSDWISLFRQPDLSIGSV